MKFDGQRLIWPWGEDRCGINQLQSETEWLREFIHKRTGLRVNPKAILALPGWYVTEGVVGAFRVANHKLLPTIVREWNPQPITDQQIDLISRQLDERCRDPPPSSPEFSAKGRGLIRATRFLVLPLTLRKLSRAGKPPLQQDSEK